jgi:hypothetical protein
MKKILIILLLLLIGIQFIIPNKNRSTEVSVNDISNGNDVSIEIQNILKNSCYDCHSNNTQYPWYNKIAPVSWILANHVHKGKEHLNFSKWKSYNNEQKNHILEELEEVLKKNEMPLKSYILLHKEAKLTSKEVEKILNWVEYKKSKNNNHE